MSKASRERSGFRWETVARRLREAGLATDRFIKVQAGSKKALEQNWTEGNQYEPDDPELRAHVERGGNVGVVCGRRLVVVDIDDRDAAPDTLGDLPETFAVESGGGGTHLYLRSKWTDTKDLDWGEVRADGAQVVAPGSTHPSGATYKTAVNTPIEPATPTTIEAVVNDSDASNADSGTATIPAEDHSHGRGGPARDSTGSGRVSIGDAQEALKTVRDTPSISLSDDDRDRVEAMFDGPRGDQLQELAQGNYAAEGWPADRSRAELSLMNGIAARCDNHPETVARIMTWFCQQWPVTDENEDRKWTDRDDIYQEVTLATACTQEIAHDAAKETIPFDDRPDVSPKTVDRVLLALQFGGPLSTAEIAMDPSVHVGKDQIRRTLKILEGRGWVKNYRDPEDRRTLLYDVVDQSG